MNSAMKSRLLTGAAFVATIAVVVATATRSHERPEAAAPAVAPAAPLLQQLQLVHAERWQVEQPFRHVWRADQPLVNRGWLLVLAGDPASMIPRQTKEPVLYVGNETADRVNTGRDSGRLVVLVPGDFWLEDAPIFFGDEALPEELHQPQIDAQLAAARAAGVVAPTAEAAAQVTTAGSQTFATDFELRRHAIDLVEQYSPGEKDLIAGWRVPLVK